jgi:hypothetical protein
MNLLRKFGRGFSILALASLVWFETKERNKRLEELLRRYEEKRKISC